MGRWSQSRRAGGGPPTLNYMVFAQIDDSTNASIRFAFPITPAQLSAVTFTTSAAGRTKTAINQSDLYTVVVTFNGTILTDTSVTTGGTGSGIRIPQSILFE